MCEPEPYETIPTDMNEDQTYAYYDTETLRTYILAYGSHCYDDGYKYGLLRGLCIGLGFSYILAKVCRM